MNARLAPLPAGVSTAAWVQTNPLIVTSLSWGHHYSRILPFRLHNNVLVQRLQCTTNLTPAKCVTSTTRTVEKEFDINRVKVMNPLDAICNIPREDAVCVSNLKSAKPIDHGIVQERPNVKIFLPFRFYTYKPAELFQENTYKNHLVSGDGDLVVSLVDEISYKPAPAPPLSQMDELSPELFCNGDNLPANCPVDCRCTHMVDVPLNAIVEIVLVDEVQSPNLSHPFHLHGTSYHVVGMGRAPNSNIKINLKHALELDRNGLLRRQFDNPPSKDTIAVPNNGYVVLRLKADNPGYWLFHCHFLYHIVIGMGLILHVGTKEDLPPIPPNFPRCGHHIPTISPSFFSLY